MITSRSDTTMAFADRVRMTRLHFRLSQEDLAGELVRRGWPLDRSIVSRYETGDRQPPDLWEYELAVHEAVEALVGK